MRVGLGAGAVDVLLGGLGDPLRLLLGVRLQPSASARAWPRAARRRPAPARPPARRRRAASSPSCLACASAASCGRAPLGVGLLLLGAAGGQRQLEVADGGRPPSPAPRRAPARPRRAAPRSRWRRRRGSRRPAPRPAPGSARPAGRGAGRRPVAGLADRRRTSASSTWSCSHLAGQGLDLRVRLLALGGQRGDLGLDLLHVSIDLAFVVAAQRDLEGRLGGAALTEREQVSAVRHGSILTRNVPPRSDTHGVTGRASRLGVVVGLASAVRTATPYDLRSVASAAVRRQPVVGCRPAGRALPCV